MVEQSPTQESDAFFNQAWAELLVEKAVFQGEPSTWRITNINCKHVLKAVNVNVEQFQQALTRYITNSPEDELTFSEFCKFYHTQLIKAANSEIRSMDDTDLLETPAQKIISLLREI